MWGHVALLTSNAAVLSLQWVSGQPVVELFQRRLPMNEREIGSVMLTMASHTVFAARVFHLEMRVIPALLRKQSRNFFVAVEALESGRVCAKLMAACTLRRSAQRLVRLGESTRGNLALHGGANHKQTERDDEIARKPGEHKTAPAKMFDQEHATLQELIEKKTQPTGQRKTITDEMCASSRAKKVSILETQRLFSGKN